MSSTKQKLRQKLGLIGAFAALATLALAISCRGFFVKTSWASIAIQPPSPTVAVGFNQQLQAWGTDTQGQRSQITSNIVWSLSNPSSGTVGTLTAGGLFTGTSVGTITVSASSEGISGTATATVAEEVATMTILPATQSVLDDGNSWGHFTITSGSIPLTSLVTLTAYSQANPPVLQPLITCGFEFETVGDATQDCQPQAGIVAHLAPPQTFNIVVTYAGYTGTAQVSAQMTVTAP